MGLLNKFVSASSKSKLKKKIPNQRKLFLERLEDRTVPATILGTNFQGMTFNDDDPRYVPPDTHGAIGPTHFVEIVNASIAFYDRNSGTQVFVDTLENFFDSVRISDFVFDPVVYYDEYAQRFIAIALDVDFNNEIGSFDIAVSNTSDPTQGWTEMRNIDVTDPSLVANDSCWGDYPKFGYNNEAWFLTLNMFGFNSNFSHVSVITIDKATALDQNNATFSSFDVDRGGGIFTMGAAAMHDLPSNNNSMLFATASSGGGSTIRVTRMTNYFSNNPTFIDTQVQVTPYVSTGTISDPGGPIVSKDSRMMNVAWRNNRLVATHAVNSGGPRARWYEIDTTNTATLLQSGTINPGNGSQTHYPAIEINCDLSIGLVWMQSGPNEPLSIYAAARAASDPLGTLQTPVRLKAGEANHLFDGRLGDYSGIGIDPLNPLQFWGTSEYCESDGTWGTWIGAFRLPPPTASDDSYSTMEDVPLVVPAASGVLSNDTNAAGVQLVTGTSNGTLVLNADGSFTYTPNANYFGTDSFVYRLTNCFVGTITATVTLTVTPVNDRPFANNDFYVANPGVPLVINPPGVLLNDTDVENSPLTASLTFGPQKASFFVFNSNGSFTYTANSNSSGNDFFFYLANDGQLDSVNTGQVVIHINRITTTRADRYATVMNTPLVAGTVALGVLGNDFDADNDPLTVQLVTAPSSGSLTLNTNGTFTYNPANGFFGEVTFVYKTFDGYNFSADTTATIRVDRKPTAAPDFYFVQQDRSITVQFPGVLSNDSDLDGDLLTARLLSGPTKGVLDFTVNGYFTYTPNPGVTGIDTFTYAASDGVILIDGSRVLSDSVTVTLNILPAVQANNDIYASYGPTLNVIAPGVMTNDTNPNNRVRSAILNNAPLFGTLTLNPNGSFSYQAVNNFIGVDSFTYHVNDGLFDSNIATVQIIVNPVNRPPVAVNDSYTTDRGVPINEIAPGILLNDSDPDVGQTITPILVSGVSNGNLNLNPDGSFTYTPLANFVGTDSFTYKLSDGITFSNVATVTFRVGDATQGNPRQRIVVTGDSADGSVKILAGETGEVAMTIFPYPQYFGAIRVATGDVNGDGIPDIITSTATSNKVFPVQVFDGSTGNAFAFSVFPFGNTYKGGIHVAAGDVNGDGTAEIIMSADATNTTSSVRVFRADGTAYPGWLGTGWKPYGGTAFGGVRVAAGDVNGDGKAEIITAPGAGIPTIRVYNPTATNATTGLIRSFNGFSSAVTGGVYIATGILNGQASIVVGAHTPVAGTAPVRVFKADGTGLRTITPTSGVGAARVAIGDVNGDGKLDIIVGQARTGGSAKARVYDAVTLGEMFNSSPNYIFDPLYNGAVFVAALNRT